MVIGIMFVTLYVTAQQVLRTNANWPQIQIAEDVAAQLNNNNLTPQSLIGNSVDMSKSLASFTSIYDVTGRTVTGSGYLDGQVAVPPKGILTSAEGQPYNAVTWQPKSGVRIAAVVVKAKNYYVLSGRSLVEVEKNEGQILTITLVGGLLSLVIVGGIVWLKLRIGLLDHSSRK